MTNEHGGTCQFCEKWGHGRNAGRNTGRTAALKYSGKVKYGVRHYAHFECFLDLKGPAGLRKLHAWQVRQFPYALLKERGAIFLDIAQQAGRA